MAANVQPIFPLTPYAVSAPLTGSAACTTRAPTETSSLAGAYIFAFVPTSTNGLRVDKIQVQACASAIDGATTAGLVGIWMHDGTKAYLIDEIPVTAVTPNATATLAFTSVKTYSNLVLPSTFSLYASTTQATTAAVGALSVIAYGGAY